MVRKGIYDLHGDHFTGVDHRGVGGHISLQDFDADHKSLLGELCNHPSFPTVDKLVAYIE